MERYRYLKLVAAASLAVGGLTLVSVPGTVWAGEGTHMDENGATGRDRTGQITPDQTVQHPLDRTAGSQNRPEAIQNRIVVYGVLVPNNVKQEELPAGFQQTQLKESSEIQKSISALTEAAINKGDFSKIEDCLVPADQQRLKQARSQENDTLDNALAELQKTWKDKYDSDLDANEVAQALNDQFTIKQGRLTNVAMLRNWPVNPTGRGIGEAQPAGSMEQPSTQPSNESAQPGSMNRSDRNISGSAGSAGSAESTGSAGSTGSNSAAESNSGADRSNAGQESNGMGNAGATGSNNGMDRTGAAGENRMPSNETGRQAAVVVFPQSQGLSKTYVSMLKEGDQWKIDIPDTLSTQQIQDNLARQIDYVNQRKDQLPSDKNEAASLLAHHVVAALYSVEPGQRNMDKMNDMNRENSGAATPESGGMNQPLPSGSGGTGGR